MQAGQVDAAPEAKSSSFSMRQQTGGTDDAAERLRQELIDGTAKDSLTALKAEAAR